MSTDPEVMSGTPVFVGTKEPVQTLFDFIEGGDDLSAFLDDFPSGTKEPAIAVLQMAKQRVTYENPQRKIMPDENQLIQLKVDLGPEDEVYIVPGKGWLGQKNRSFIVITY